jgi:Ni/Fe-hydrogenase subunit HybB-like protein
MDENPYESPKQVVSESQAKPNRLIVVAMSILALVFAADLISGGIVKTFVWGFSYQMPYQFAYGIISLAGGLLILERLVTYFRRRYFQMPPSRSGAGRIPAVLIWAIISVAVLIDVVSIVRALTR